ncbi:MAG TPA: M20 family metallopeptidase [Bacteroidales bacterium]|nr:M20 family metallopeptidase [Bacteroidales bacterium]
MNNIKNIIKDLSLKLFEQIVEIRREIHQYPELAFNEYKTSQLIVKTLSEHKIIYKKGIAKTGVIAFVQGKKNSNKCIAIRVELDALPIQEKTSLEYKSLVPGIMHACGHDIHIASAIGTAIMLNKLKNNFSGTVKILFQPSEEKLPGGALSMIKEKVLTSPTPQSIIGQHTSPEIETGKIGIKSGNFMASADEIYISVKGKGGHAAMPHLLIDPIVIASHIIIALQQIISRNANPLTPSVLSFGKFIANGETNIIPDIVKISGTFRTLDEKWRTKAHSLITKVASDVAKSMKAQCEVKIIKGYPILYNNIELTEKIKKYAIEYLGETNVIDIEPRLTADDFAYFALKKPSCYYRLGVGNKNKRNTSKLHTPYFNPNETSIITGMGLMTWIIINELQNY